MLFFLYYNELRELFNAVRQRMGASGRVTRKQRCADARLSLDLGRHDACNGLHFVHRLAAMQAGVGFEPSNGQSRTTSAGGGTKPGSRLLDPRAAPALPCRPSEGALPLAGNWKGGAAGPELTSPISRPL